jgi:hypothetical protein
MYTVLPYSEFVGGGGPSNDEILEELMKTLSVNDNRKPSQKLNKNLSFNDNKKPSQKLMKALSLTNKKTSRPPIRQLSRQSSLQPNKPPNRPPIRQLSQRKQDADNKKAMAEIESMFTNVVHVSQTQNAQPLKESTKKQKTLRDYSDDVTKTILTSGLKLTPAFVNNLVDSIMDGDDDIQLSPKTIVEDGFFKKRVVLNFLVDLVLVQIVWNADNTDNVIRREAFKTFFLRVDPTGKGSSMMQTLLSKWGKDKHNNRDTYGAIQFTSLIKVMTMKKINELNKVIEMKPQNAMHPLVPHMLRRFMELHDTYKNENHMDEN